MISANKEVHHTIETEIEGLELALMAVAYRVQLTPSQYQDCERRYRSLARHVDRHGSPLKERVLEVYPSGSQAIHAATLSHVKSAHHDLDAVLELDLPQDTDPEIVLELLYSAIKGDVGSKYHDHHIVKNSRCVTVHYADGVTVDLMPVIRTPGQAERAARLFHYKAASADDQVQRYTKPVNPWGFSTCFNESVVASSIFESRFGEYRKNAQRTSMLDEKAETQPMPAPVPLSQKSTRVVALQLIKRFRDKRFRRSDHQAMKAPPSVVFSEQIRGAGQQANSLDEELRNLSVHLIDQLQSAENHDELIRVVNPVYSVDIFTDRWPSCRLDQRQWQADLQHLVQSLDELRLELFDPAKWQRVFRDLFGEAASNDAIKSWYDRQKRMVDAGQVDIGRVGNLRENGIRAGRSASAATSVVAGAAIPAQTFDGGSLHDLDH